MVFFEKEGGRAEKRICFTNLKRTSQEWYIRLPRGCLVLKGHLMCKYQEDVEHSDTVG